MSDDITADAGEQTETTESESQFKSPATQEELDRIIQARVARVSSKYADYEELQKAASRLKEIEEANKSESEKAQARAEAAERRASELELQVLRADVASEKGVPAKLLAGSTREELEAAADELIAFRGEQKPPVPKSSAFGRVNQPSGSPVPTSPGMGTLRAAYGS